jgi:hypothetical protein
LKLNNINKLFLKGVLNMTKLEIQTKKELAVKNNKIIDLKQYISDLENEIYAMDKELKSYSTAPVGISAMI